MAGVIEEAEVEEDSDMVVVEETLMTEAHPWEKEVLQWDTMIEIRWEVATWIEMYFWYSDISLSFEKQQTYLFKKKIL